MFTRTIPSSTKKAIPNEGPQDSMVSNSPRFGEVSDLKTFRKHYQNDIEESLFIPVSVNYGVAAGE